MTTARGIAAAAGYASWRLLAAAVASDPGAVAEGLRVDADWKRHVDGHAVRLGPREVIAPSRPVGRWVGVDTRRPYDGWRSASALAAVSLWAGIVGGAAWLGRRRGAGPLSGLASYGAPADGR